MAKAALFSSSTPELCPHCGAELVIRSGKHGPFQGCSAYPTCDFVRPLRSSSEGHIVKILEGLNCPECGATKVLKQGRYGMFVGCSRFPDCDYSEALAQADSTGIQCPQCRKSSLVQRQSRFGKTFYSCSGYPACQFALNYPPVAGECQHCHSPLLYQKKTAKGTKVFCANKQCGVEFVPFSEE